MHSHVNYGEAREYPSAEGELAEEALLDPCKPELAKERLPRSDEANGLPEETAFLHRLQRDPVWGSATLHCPSQSTGDGLKGSRASGPASAGDYFPLFYLKCS